MNNLLQNIGNLSAAEKLKLIDALWESIETDSPALTVEQLQELDAREARYRQNPSDVRSWEQVKAGLLKSADASRCLVARSRKRTHGRSCAL